MSNVEILPQVAAFLDRQHGCFIDGQWVFAEGPSIAVVNPATGQTLCETLDAPLELVERAVQSSHKAFKSGVWSSLRPAAAGSTHRRSALRSWSPNRTCSA